MHYLTFVITNMQPIVAAEKNIAVLLAPYASDIEVAPYLVPCVCLDFRPDVTPACSLCNARGVIESTSNPVGMWDYYAIGGDWDGVLEPDYPGASHAEDVERNVIIGTQLPEQLCDWLPHSIVTPDGNWHGHAGNNWTPISDADMEKWSHAATELLADYRNDRYLVAAVDCHI